MASFGRQLIDDEMEETKSLTEETIDLLNTIKDNTNNCIQMASNLLSRIKDNQLSAENGNSFVELKNKIFISYLMDLTFLMWNKISGQQIEGSDAIKRLVENRTVLERMKPIEHKLKYTFDKLIKTSNEGTVDPNDPLNFKPKLNTIMGANDEQMATEEDNQQEDSGEEQSEQTKELISKAKSGVYVPPKVAQMRFDEEEDRKTKALERAKKRAINSSIIAELRREFDTGPEEVSHSSHTSNTRIHRFLKDKTAYEEEYMTRMSLTKKQRNEAKKVQTMSSLSGMTRFEDISALDVDNADDFQLPNKKKRGSKPKNSKTTKRKKFTKLRK